jgi:hypothetical protein
MVSYFNFSPSFNMEILNTPQIIRIPLNIGNMEEQSCESENNTNDMYGLGERDTYMNKMEEQIREKREFLMNRQLYLRKEIKHNKYLEKVKNDYDRYNTYIIKQKEQQIKAMNIINSYIEDMKVSGKLTEEGIKEIRMEQKEIIHETNKLRKSINEIIGISA